MSAATLYVFAYLLMNLTQQTMWYCAFSRLFPAKLPPRFYYPLVLVLNAIACFLTYVPLSGNTALRLVISNTYFVFFMLLLHRGNLLRKLLAVLAIFLTMVLTELTTLLLAPMASVYIQNGDFCHLELIPFYILFLLAQALYLAIIVYAFRLLDKKSENRVSNRNRFYYVLLPINQFVLLSIWYYYYIFTSVEPFTTKKFIIVLMVLFFSVLTDILLFRLISRTAENAELHARNELMEEQMAVKAKYYQLMAQSYSNMRQMRHDIANHICTIHAMLQSNEKDAAQKYVAELEKTTAVRSLLSDCQNTAVDAFLRERMENLAAQGITLSVDIHLPPYCFVSDVDLITALGNLLDNAADACRQLPDAHIAVKASLSDGFLHIETENPYSPDGGKKERRISYMERGTGVSILRSLAEKYGGCFTSRANGHIYNNTLILKEPPNHG